MAMFPVLGDVLLSQEFYIKINLLPIILVAEKYSIKAQTSSEDHNDSLSMGKGERQENMKG